MSRSEASMYSSAMCTAPSLEQVRVRVRVRVRVSNSR